MVLVVLLCSPLTALPADTLTLDIATLLRAESLQGAVWSTRDSKGDIQLGAAGLSNADTGAKMRPDHRVHVGSIPKSLLAAGTLQLVTEGRLSLDTPLSVLLPDVILENPWAATNPVRLRHLLDHTSGLDDARLSQVFSLEAKPDTPLTEAFERSGSLLRVRSKPGTRFSYSNMGYTLIGRVIEAVTKERYETYLERHLLLPLGMRDSTFAFVTQTGPYGDPRLAMGHFENGVTQVAAPMYLRPASQFTTTAADMIRYARFLMSDGIVDGKLLIALPLLDAMGEPQGTEAAQAGLKIGYALGMVTRDRYGAIGKCHAGSTVGFKAMLCTFPAQKSAFFIAVNADNESANYGRFDDALIKHLSIRSPAPATAAAELVDPTSWEGFYVPSPNRFASLAWVDTVFNFVRVRANGADLQFTPFQSPTVALKHVEGKLYRAPGRITPSHVLITAHDGARVISTGNQSYEKVSILKLAPLWGSLLLGLLGLGYLLVAGLVRIARRETSARHLVPFAGAAALLLPLPLFYRQSYLEMGDFTFASASLAAVTALLPLTIAIGLGLNARRWRHAVLDMTAMLGVLQFAVVLAVWGMLPFRLWA